jgi:hypothetical protein
MPAQTPADGPSGVTDGSSGYADARNTRPARAASIGDLRYHAVRPERRGIACAAVARAKAKTIANNLIIVSSDRLLKALQATLALLAMNRMK